MSRFNPIAIVGQACVLPGALTPEALFQAVRNGKDLVSSANLASWGVRASRILSAPSPHRRDTAYSDRGGYVQGFAEVFDAAQSSLTPETIKTLDPLCHWLLYAGHRALDEAKWSGDLSRAGIILGNLSYPTSSMCSYAENIWLERLQSQGGPRFRERTKTTEAHACHRFMSGLPVHLLAQSLGFRGNAFALDAACASSLYALKLACDSLQDGRTDLMLAGAVNRADDLFLHVGFSALHALSETGQSRPFHPEADGLLPAEGACVFALRRLEDAERDGTKILGVIRGIGLSNDGRGRGLLVPTQSGQVHAIRQALTVSELTADDIDFIECHATGTKVGDATEIASLHEVFGRRKKGLPIGSFKANAGHLITAAGGAGLMKVLGAINNEELPPNPPLDALHPDLAPASLRVLQQPEDWASNRVRRAAVSAFGFGGNNAHLIVEEYRRHTPRRSNHKSLRDAQIAIVALATRIADGKSTFDFETTYFNGETRVRSRDGTMSAHGDQVELAMKGLKFPPADLEQTLPQQLLLLAAAREASTEVKLNPARTSIFSGMQCDAEIARHGARWRMIEWAQAWHADPNWIEEARDGFIPCLGAAGVIGAMPNIVANRINSQLDLSGPSFSVSSEELSGIRALQIAKRALIHREIDAAVVGAVDICCEEVHEHAAQRLLPEGKKIAGDAAVVLIVKRLEDAKRDGDNVLALLQDSSFDTPAPHPGVDLTLETDCLTALYGHAHAASGLVQVAAGVLSCARQATPLWLQPSDKAPLPRQSGEYQVEVRVEALGGQNAALTLASFGSPQTRVSPQPSPFDGPVLKQRLHTPPPHLPPLPRRQELHPKEMSPAPHLPPLMTENSDFIAVQRLNLDRQTNQTSTTAEATPLPQTSTSVLLQRSIEISQALSCAHQAFLNDQSALHAQFLQLRSNTSQAWLQVPQPTLPLAPSPIDSRTGPLHRSTEQPGNQPTQHSDAYPRAPEGPSPFVATNLSPIAPTANKDITSPGGRVHGPSFSREQLQIHSSGRISDIFGEKFKNQDKHDVQVRMPEPPLLLADRIVGIAAEPDSMGLGTVWSETDVHEDSWFVHRGRVPAGVLIECGQADLFLISYLGIDRFNQGKRAYRLLGCELTYHGSSPRIGDTLHFDIHVDAHAAQGDVRLFFFHSDCHVGQRPIMSVRNGQAGFFTEQELKDSAGVLWTPLDEKLSTNQRLDDPIVLSQRTEFTVEQVSAFAQGDLYGCFGPGFERGKTHTDSPTIQFGDLNFIDTIDGLDPNGGPWGRGYARATTAIHTDDWFFDGHFKNDPCMPGTLMFEGCLQLMAFYLAALGHTLNRDGWSFEPVPEVAYQLHCRGQVLPTSTELICEIFVEEVHDGPQPTVFAHLLGTVDGQKAFHARHVGLRLVPDWPLESQPKLLDAETRKAGHTLDASTSTKNKPKPIAKADGFQFDYPSLLACAWGKPSAAFGPMYAPFDSVRRVARLPGPPYHFMSRVIHVQGDIDKFEPGAEVEIEYDVPADAWYFENNGAPVMPFAVLLEVALQPCGWLASYVGSALRSNDDLSFRNLDGKGRVLAEVGPDVGTIRTHSRITNISQSGGMIIQSFEVACYAKLTELDKAANQETCIYELKTVFGFFPAAALANQIGLPAAKTHQDILDTPSNFFVDLKTDSSRYLSGASRLAKPMLRMIDRVTSLNPQGGAAKLGTLRCEKDVDPGEWFFKAHFFQDPVQPGSLGIEVMLQLLQFYMLETNADALQADPQEPLRFEAIKLGSSMSWKYRGQVVPENRVICTTLEVTERGNDEQGIFARANASLWVDGKRIYEATGLAMRLVSEPALSTRKSHRI